MRHIYGVCANEDCPACTYLAESRATRDDVPESDRGQRADELAGRDERAADERWGNYAC